MSFHIGPKCKPHICVHVDPFTTPTDTLVRLLAPKHDCHCHHHDSKPMCYPGQHKPEFIGMEDQKLPVTESLHKPLHPDFTTKLEPNAIIQIARSRTSAPMDGELEPGELEYTWGDAGEGTLWIGRLDEEGNKIVVKVAGEGLAAKAVVMNDDGLVESLSAIEASIGKLRAADIVIIYQNEDGEVVEVPLADYIADCVVIEAKDGIVSSVEGNKTTIGLEKLNDSELVVGDGATIPSLTIDEFGRVVGVEAVPVSMAIDPTASMKVGNGILSTVVSLKDGVIVAGSDGIAVKLDAGVLEVAPVVDGNTIALEDGKLAAGPDVLVSADKKLSLVSLSLSEELSVPHAEFGDASFEKISVGTIENDVTVEGNMKVGGHFDCVGHFDVSGSLIVESDQSIAVDGIASAVVNGDLSVAKDFTIAGDILASAEDQKLVGFVIDEGEF